MNTASQTVRPLPDKYVVPDAQLSDWQAGEAKPGIDGLYLREFEEGEGVSEFHHGKWLREGFFPSDIQDAPWRGLRATA